MRFLISRILKNFPLINKQWKSFLNFCDFKYYDKHCKNYIIIPFGTYCMPRVITNINRFKPSKLYGEKSYPFDLMFSNLNSNILMLKNNFKDFFENITFCPEENYWKNEKYNYIFNHDNTSIKEFKERYSRRIKNLYNALKSREKYLYFLIATFDQITQEQIYDLKNAVNKYRPDNSYSIIIINQSKTLFKFALENVFILNLCDDTLFEKINYDGDWVNHLKRMKGLNERKFNREIVSFLSKIIIN